ncbi:MAG: ABC transporter permease [Pseudomonadales bacterium]|nr:ABC transporter permease [Pseudomonadales bacterium]
MEIGPILRAMTRNKLGVVLIALQIAFTMTVMINAIFIINERNRMMARPSGADEANLFHFTSIGFGEDYNERIVVADDLAMIRQLPGVVNASTTNAIPVSGSGSSTGVRLEFDESQPSVGVAIYRTDDQLINTLNLDLLAGEGFTESDMRYRSESGATLADKTVVSRAAAENLFPDMPLNQIVGETVFLPGGVEVQIIGIVETLQAPWPQSSLIERSMIVPEMFVDTFSLYVVRTEPGERDRVMAEIEDLLLTENSNRVLRSLRSLEDTREETYRIDSAMSTVLWIIIITLVFITCMGIVGLAVFGINRRRKQIGTRRALGATRPEILRHFMVENLLITSVGVLVGAALTIGFSIVLTTNFNMPTMAWYYTPLGMLALMLIGQIAVLGPSSGAAKIEPAIATRSV